MGRRGACITCSGKHRLARCVEGRGGHAHRQALRGRACGPHQPRAAPAHRPHPHRGTDLIPAEARDAATSVLSRALVQYTPTAGLSHLRSAVAQRVRGRAAERVIITSGSQEALWVSVMGLGNPGEDVLFPEPGKELIALPAAGAARARSVS